VDALRGPRCDASHSCAAGRRLAAAAIVGEHRSASTVKQAAQGQGLRCKIHWI
jgi:hypothetical protein